MGQQLLRKHWLHCAYCMNLHAAITVHEREVEVCAVDILLQRVRGDDLLDQSPS